MYIRLGGTHCSQPVHWAKRIMELIDIEKALRELQKALYVAERINMVPEEYPLKTIVIGKRVLPILRKVEQLSDEIIAMGAAYDADKPCDVTLLRIKLDVMENIIERFVAHQYFDAHKLITKKTGLPDEW